MSYKHTHTETGGTGHRFKQHISQHTQLKNIRPVVISIHPDRVVAIYGSWCRVWLQDLVPEPPQGSACHFPTRSTDPGVLQLRQTAVRSIRTIRKSIDQYSIDVASRAIIANDAFPS